MRRRFGLLVGTTGLLLATSLATAGAAEARNVGGTVIFGESCIQPGVITLSGAAKTNAPCVCASTELTDPYRNVGRTGATSGDCPRGVPTVKIDRNVGG